jgi:hypothetical protein
MDGPLLLFLRTPFMHLSEIILWKCSDELGEKYADGVNWDELGFGIIPTDSMYTMKCSDGDNFSQGHLIPYGNIELCPSAGILNYGQVGRARFVSLVCALLTHSLKACESPQ